MRLSDLHEEDEYEGLGDEDQFEDGDTPPVLTVEMQLKCGTLQRYYIECDHPYHELKFIDRGGRETWHIDESTLAEIYRELFGDKMFCFQSNLAMPHHANSPYMVIGHFMEELEKAGGDAEAAREATEKEYWVLTKPKLIVALQLKSGSLELWNTANKGDGTLDCTLMFNNGKIPGEGPLGWRKGVYNKLVTRICNELFGSHMQWNGKMRRFGASSIGGGSTSIVSDLVLASFMKRYQACGDVKQAKQETLAKYGKRR